MKRVNVVSIQLVKEKSVSYETKKINSPMDAVNILERFMENADRESFMILCLDTKNNVNAINTVSVGTLNSSLVHPREVFKAAILSNSNAIILSHNHPSGNPSPSNEDIEITRRLEEAGNIMGIQVLDHVIMGENGRYVSLKERGAL